MGSEEREREVAVLEVLRRERSLGALGAAASLAALGELLLGLSWLGSGSLGALQAGLFLVAAGYAVACGTLVGTAWSVVVAAGEGSGPPASDALFSDRRPGPTTQGAFPGTPPAPVAPQPRTATPLAVVELLRSGGALGAVALGGLLGAFGSLGSGSDGLVDAGAVAAAVGYGALALLLGGWAGREALAVSRGGAVLARSSDLLLVASGGLGLLAASAVVSGTWFATTLGKLAAIEFVRGVAWGALAAALGTWALRRGGRPETLGLATLAVTVAGLGRLLAGFGFLGSQRPLVVTGDVVGALGLALLGTAAVLHGLRLAPPGAHAPFAARRSDAAGGARDRAGDAPGADLPRACAHCGAPLFPSARFCPGCGWPAGPVDRD
jgi:hypothetical protein